MMSDGIDLDPCPFCGGEAVFLVKCPPTIRCTNCSSEMVVGISSHSGMTANVWNSRVKLKAVPDGE